MTSITKRRYTDDFKSQAVDLAESAGRTPAARQLGISIKTLDNWIRLARDGKPWRSPERKPISEQESELARFRAENAELRMEREILKKSAGVLRQGVQMRYAFVARERAHFPTHILCRVMQVSVSGFHDFRQRQNRPEPDAAVRKQLREVHVHSRRTYGRPRLVKVLRSRNQCVGHKRVARLMREEGLRGKSKGCFKPQTTDSRHAQPVPKTDWIASSTSTAACLHGQETSLTSRRVKAGFTWPP